MLTPQNMLDKIKGYSIAVDEDFFTKAYIFALDKHGIQIRESGEPYVSHPLEVASMLIDLRMDQTTIISGILHDTVEDTNTTIKEIEQEFGSEIANIVNGITKFSKLEISSLEEKQSENFKKLLISASSDIRILIIKLIDRLHNMRTIQYKKKKLKKEHIAKETIEIYAPIAERIGLYGIKNELQDIAFYELYPDIYQVIKSKLENMYESIEKIIDDIISHLKKLTEEIELPCKIQGRLKTIYSIWAKMNVKNMSFDQLSDIMAFRIIVDTIPECYKALGAIHKQYLIIPRRFRDYISTPKVNGYQSLHTCIIGPLNKKIEIQIRTKEMHLISKYGIAAHWGYKNRDNNSTIASKKTQNEYEWIQKMINILENSDNIDDFFKISKIEILSNQVFCLTPKGRVISLPSGSSVLDFAYAIHSEIGNRATCAKINGNFAKLKTIVENGDQIEVITDKYSSPKFSWEDYVITIKAKNYIKKAQNSLTKEKNTMIGQKSIEEFFRRHNFSLGTENIQKISKHLEFDDVDALFLSLGSGSTNIREIFTAYNKVVNFEPKEFPEESYNQYCPINISTHIASIPDVPISPVTCCFQVPGDKIVGLWLLKNNSIEIHIEGCQKLEQCAKSNTIELSWQPSAFTQQLQYPTNIFVTIYSQPGNLAKVSNIIEEHNINIISLKIGEKIDNFVELKIGIEVENISELTLLISSLRRSDFVNKVSRQNIS